MNTYNTVCDYIQAAIVIAVVFLVVKLIRAAWRYFRDRLDAPRKSLAEETIYWMREYRALQQAISEATDVVSVSTGQYLKPGESDLAHLQRVAIQGHSDYLGSLRKYARQSGQSLVANARLGNAVYGAAQATGIKIGFGEHWCDYIERSAKEQSESLATKTALANSYYLALDDSAKRLAEYFPLDTAINRLATRSGKPYKLEHIVACLEDVAGTVEQARKENEAQWKEMDGAMTALGEATGVPWDGHVPIEFVARVTTHLNERASQDASIRESIDAADLDAVVASGRPQAKNAAATSEDWANAAKPITAAISDSLGEDPATAALR